MRGVGIRALQGARGLFNPLRLKVPANSCCVCGPEPMIHKTVWKFWQEKGRVETFGKEAGTNLLFLIKWMFFGHMLEAVMVAYVSAGAAISDVGEEGADAILIGASATHGFRPLYRARVCWGGGGGRTLFSGGLGSFCKAEVKELEPVLAPEDFTIQDIARNAKYASV